MTSAGINDCIACVGIRAPTNFKTSLKFFEIDFKKKDGYKKTSKLADGYGFYRQKHCGCEFSIRE